MDCEIRLEDLFLKSCVVKVHDRSLLNSGGTMKFELLGSQSKPEYDEDDQTATVGCIVKVDVAGKLHPSPSGEEEDVFDLVVEFAGAFVVTKQIGELFEHDEDARTSLSERFANRIFPAMRIHVNQTLSLMGVTNFELPWHLTADFTENDDLLD